MTTSPEPEPPVIMRMHARWWASKGIAVLPLHHPVEGAADSHGLVCSCGNPECEGNAAKHPIFDPQLGLRKGLNDATTDLAVIDTWWARYPQANIGGRTGEIVDLIDIDSAEGFASFGKLVAELGGMPEHFGIAMSGRDGFGQHIYVAPGGQKALAGGKTAPTGIDVKGRGGYAVLPPSRHISGNRYSFRTTTFDDGVLKGAVPWPDFYRRLEIRPTVTTAPRAPRTTTLPLDAANAYGAAVLRRALSLVEQSMSGTRWQTLATEAIPLIARGVDGGCIDRDSAVRELEDVARSVGLDRREVSRIGPLVDDMIARGIRNPIHPKDAAAQIADLIASPADLLRPTPPSKLTALASDDASGASGGSEEGEADAASGGDPRTDPWEPPWPLKHPTPPFPVETMDWMGPEIVGLAEQLQCSVDLIAMMTLAAVSATIRGRIRAEFAPGWEEPLNLYLAVIAEPGETKSPALAKILRPLYDMEREAREKARDVIVSKQFDRDFAEQRAKKLRETALQMRDPQEAQMAQEAARQSLVEAQNVKVPAEPVYLAGEMTPEALVAMLAEQGGTLAHLSAEGALFDTIVGGRYSNGAPQLSQLLMAHDGREPIKVHRKGSPSVEVPNPCLTIGLAVQPDVVRKLGENEAAMGRGLAARFLFSIPNSLVGRRDMRLRRVGEEFQGFRALLREVNALASGSSEEGSGDYGHRIRRESGESRSTERWRRSGQPVNSELTPQVDSGDYGHQIRVESGKAGGTAWDPEQSGFGHYGHRSLKYFFGESSSSLVTEYRQNLEPRRAAETGDLSEVGPWANKLDGQVLRLATVLQVIRDVSPERSPGPPEPSTYDFGAHSAQNPRREVGVEAVAAARILADYLIAHSVEAHALMHGADGGPALARATQLLGWIRSRGKTEFTAHEAERSLRNRATFRDQNSVRHACETLVRLGWLRVVPPEPGRPGRPSLRLLAHPDVFTSE